MQSLNDDTKILTETETFFYDTKIFRNRNRDFFPRPNFSQTETDTFFPRPNSPTLALFDMPNLNRFDIFSISIFCKIALSISIFSKITISISISIFLELPYRYRYRYRYFSELPYRYRYRYRYFQLLHIDIDIDIFQKCRYIDNRYFISIF